MPQTPAEVASAIFDALNRRDISAVEELQHEDLVENFIAIGVFEGRPAVRAFFDEMFGAMPDFALRPERITSDGDRAVVEWHASGTFTGGPFQGVLATGRPVELRGIDVMVIVDGRLKENTIYYDGLSFARQIGLLPREGSRADRALMTVFNARTSVLSKLPLTP